MWTNLISPDKMPYHAKDQLCVPTNYILWAWWKNAMIMILSFDRSFSANSVTRALEEQGQWFRAGFFIQFNISWIQITANFSDIQISKRLDARFQIARLQTSGWIPFCSLSCYWWFLVLSQVSSPILTRLMPSDFISLIAKATFPLARAQLSLDLEITRPCRGLFFSTSISLHRIAPSLKT